MRKALVVTRGILWRRTVSGLCCYPPLMITADDGPRGLGAVTNPQGAVIDGARVTVTIWGQVRSLSLAWAGTYNSGALGSQVIIGCKFVVQRL